MCDLNFHDGFLYVTISSKDPIENIDVLPLLLNFGWKFSSLEKFTGCDVVFKFERK